MNDQNVTIKLELPLAAVNAIMASLGKQPFEQVADLVQAIREQAIPQLPVPDMSNEATKTPANAA